MLLWLCILETTPEKKWPSTLANSTLLILFSEMLKISKVMSSRSQNMVKGNIESSGICHLLK